MSNGIRGDGAGSKETGTNRPISPSRLAVYAACPRQYEYDRVWNVSTPEESRRYLDRGLVYHGVIEDACNRVADEPGLAETEIRDFVRRRLTHRWDDQTDRAEYRSDAQYQYDRRLVESALESYFDEDGLAHVRNSIGTEVWLHCERDGVHLRGRADNVVRTDDGLQVIDYKGSLNNIVSWYSADSIEAHSSGAEYDPSRLKSVFQAATYIEGAKQLEAYDPEMEVEFTFYGLLKHKERTRHVDGIQVSVRGGARDVGAIYRKHEEPIWELIDDYYHRIIAGEYDPVRWDEIREHTCGDCAYQSMCGEYLTSEVRLNE